MSEFHSKHSLLMIALSALYLCALTAPVTYSSSLWGINHLQYYDWSMRLLVPFGSVALSAAIILMVTRLRLSTGMNRLVLYGLVPLLLLLVFYFLRVRHHYLGDGVLRIVQLGLGYTLLPPEPLGYLANVAVYQLTRVLFHLSGREAMETLSYLSGLATYLAALYFARTLCRSLEQRLIVFAVLMFSGVTLLYCGYAETYTLLPALLIFFFAAGVRTLEGRLSMLIPAFLYLLLVLFHFQFLYLIPSMLVLGYYQYRHKDRRSFIVSIVVLLLSLAAVVVIPLLSREPTQSLGKYLMPLLPGADSYWLFSMRHILEIVDELLLTAVAPLILLVAVLMRRRTLLATHRTSVLFAVSALPGALALLSLLYPSLGYPSDWDLYSSAGVVIAVVAVTLFASQEKFALTRTAAGALVAVGISSFVAYAAVMADYDTAMARQVDILSVSGEEAAYGFESIGNDLCEHGYPDQAEKMWQRSLKIMPHWRIYGNLGQLALDRGDPDAAQYYALKALALDSTNAVLYLTLGMAYLGQKRYELAEANLRRSCAMLPDKADFHHNFARCLGEEGKFAEAETEERVALKLEPGDPRFVAGLGCILRYEGKYVESESVLISGLKTNPESPDLIANLAVLYKKAGHPDNARDILTRYLNAYPQNQNNSVVKTAVQIVNDP